MKKYSINIKKDGTVSFLKDGEKCIIKYDSEIMMVTLEGFKNQMTVEFE